MEDIINLENNYYLKAGDISRIYHKLVDINQLKLNNILRNKIILLKIDFNNINKKEYKKILKKFLFIKSIIVKTKIQIGVLKDSKILLGYVINYDQNNKQHNDFINGINAILFNGRYKRYNYIYDTVCDFLDSGFYGKNLCDFKDNRCGEKRETSITCGCCRHYRIKLIGPLTRLVECEYLKDDHTCGAKCISCKLYTCDYLKNKGIKYRIKDILLLNVFFNPIQKYFIKYMVYTPKKKILRTLMFL